jgi:arylsulfatase A-like enzyme
MAGSAPSISRRDLLLQSSALAFGASQRRERLPNIVFFLADDFGYGDAGFLNPQSRIPTPNLDRLAKQGMHFTDAHDPSAVCTPTRYGILTGRYCWRTRLKANVLGQWAPPLIEESRLTVPSMLRSRGYTTAAFGKWHLGFDWPTADGKPASFVNDQSNVDYDKPLGGGPVSRGFDYFFGMDCPNYGPYCYIENDRFQGKPSEVFAGGDMNQGPNPVFGPIDSRRGPAMAGWKQEDVLPELTRRAAAYIEQQRGKEKPFFLYFASTGPHTPVVPSKEFQGKTQVGPYGDFVHQVDHSLGQLLAALDRAKLADNTLVIFTSDNGPEIHAYERAQRFRHYSMGSWRGVKRDSWEGGHRVPYVARWPGRIKAGSSSSEVICQTDLMSTLAALTGYRLPAEDAAEDSYNILPVLLGEKLREPVRPATVLHSARGYFALRQGPWVFIDYKTGDNNTEPEWLQKERGYEAHTQPGELYHLGRDPGQKRNVYAENPEVVAQMKALLEKYKQEGRSRA